MAVPDFQSMMFPLLKLTADGQEHTLSEAIETLAQQYKLTDDDRRELLPSGKQSKFVNRVGWSATYLRKTKLLEGTGKGRFRITERGRSELRANPARMDLRYLDKYPELAEFRRANQLADSTSSSTQVSEVVEASSQTPREILESSYQLLRRDLAQELLERIKQKPPAFFEQLVVSLHPILYQSL